MASCINLQYAIKIFETSRLLDMHNPLTDIQADFEMNQPVNYRKRNYLHRRQTDGQTSRTTTIGIFIEKKRKTTKK